MLNIEYISPVRIDKIWIYEIEPYKGEVFKVFKTEVLEETCFVTDQELRTLPLIPN